MYSKLELTTVKIEGSDAFIRTTTCNELICILPQSSKEKAEDFAELFESSFFDYGVYQKEPHLKLKRELDNQNKKALEIAPPKETKEAIQESII